MRKKGVHFPIRRVFILDELADLAAFFLALWLRYDKSFGNWRFIYDGLYVTFIIVLCLTQAIVFLAYDARRESIFVQDPVDNLLSVIKGKILLIAMVLAFLFATQTGEMSSRFVISLTFALSTVFEYVARMIYRKLYYGKHMLLNSWKTLDINQPYPLAQEVVKKVRDENYQDVLLHFSERYGNDSRKAAEEIISACESAGIRTYLSLDVDGYQVRSGIVSDVIGYASIPAFVRKERFDLFGVHYAVARTEEAVLHVMRHVKELSGQYVCFSNVHTSVMAREDSSYRNVLNEAAFVFPDGKPVAFLQQKSGIVGAERVAGPDFMQHMFRNTQDGSVSHFFYGSSQETIDSLRKKLTAKYPGINIAGMYSPPFRPLTKEEDEAAIEMINSSGADIVWIGLGAPRQEKWMNAHKGVVKGVMMGVGAGFDFHAGTIKRAPYWIQKVGLEWLYRLTQDPKRLFKRYIVTNAKFFWYLIWGNGKKE